MLLFAAGASCALTLGRMQGVALIGRPLDVGIPLSLDSPADSADACMEADVFYGDTKVDARRVNLVPSVNGTSGNVRVRVATPVDEAFVQVYLRVGCTAKYTRRYVLLTEEPVDVAEAAAVPTPVPPPVVQLPPTASPGSATSAPAAPAAPAASLAAPTQPAPVRPPQRAVARTLPAEALPAPRPAPRAATARPVPAQAPAPAPAPAPTQAATVERPRLRLDPIEVRPAGGPVAAAQAASAAAPAASAALGPDGVVQELQAQELDRNAQRIQSLEADLRKLREGMLRSDAGLIELRARLEKAEGERYANGLVYSLAGLLAVSLGGIVFLWRRGRYAQQSKPWWKESQLPQASSIAAADEEHLIEETSQAAASTASASPSKAPAPEAAQAPLAPDVRNSMPADKAASTGDGQGSPLSWPGSLPGKVPTGFGFLGNVPSTRDPQLSQGDGLRVSDPLPVTSDELSDIQQEADFFVSLGEHERAIEILRNHIEAHPQASAVAWLDLLEIHHKLGQKDEYEQVRRDFEWLFNAKAPSFTEYDEAREGLEEHPRLISRIQAAWPRREVLELIDDAVFRRPGAEGEEPINLEGYRDLLFLHTLASDLTADSAVTHPPRREGTASVPPVAAADAPILDVQHLDINLDELAGAPEPAAARAQGGEDSAYEPGRSRSMPDEGRLMEFDIDLQPQFKLPNQRSAQG